jgi:hypothetical protein
MFAFGGCQKKIKMKFIDILKESINEAMSAKVNKALASKAKSTGKSLSTIKAVYRRGLAAWKSGHRPGVPQHQWAMGRVNSFLTGKGGARKADSDLWKKTKKKK